MTDHTDLLRSLRLFHLPVSDGRRVIIAEAADAIEALEADNAALRQLIAEHNDGLQLSCESHQEAQHCHPYIARGKACPDCPRQWYIAAMREGKE